MNIATPFVSDAQEPEAMQSAQHRAASAEMLFAFDASRCVGRCPADSPLAVLQIVVALVSVQLAWMLAGTARQPRDFRKHPDQMLQQVRVMNIGRRQMRCQRQPVLIDDNVMLTTKLSSFRGVGAVVIPADGGGRNAGRVNAGTFPFAHSPPARFPATAAHLLVQVLQGNSDVQDPTRYRSRLCGRSAGV